MVYYAMGSRASLITEREGGVEGKGKREEEESSFLSFYHFIFVPHLISKAVVPRVGILSQLRSGQPFHQIPAR